MKFINAFSEKPCKSPSGNTFRQLFNKQVSLLKGQMNISICTRVILFGLAV